MTRKVIDTPYLSRPQEQPTLFISQKATDAKILTPTLHSILQKARNLSQPLPRPLCSSHEAAPASFSDIALIDHKKLAKKCEHGVCELTTPRGHMERPSRRRNEGWTSMRSSSHKKKKRGKSCMLYICSSCSNHVLMNTWSSDQKEEAEKSFCKEKQEQEKKREKKCFQTRRTKSDLLAPASAGLRPIIHYPAAHLMKIKTKTEKPYFFFFLFFFDWATRG